MMEKNKKNKKNKKRIHAWSRRRRAYRRLFRLGDEARREGGGGGDAAQSALTVRGRRWRGRNRSA